MQRLGVKAPAADSDPQATAQNTPPFRPVHRTPRMDAPEEPKGAARPPEASAPQREPIPLAPRAIAAEKNVDLSALRDLANLSAEHALGRHDFKELIRSTRSKAIVATVALAAGAGLLWHWRAHDAGTWTIVAVGLSWLIAIFWGLQYAILTGRLIINRSGGISLRRHHGDSGAHGPQTGTHEMAPNSTLGDEAGPVPMEIAGADSPSPNGKATAASVSNLSPE
jgi:hypothetical protein